MKKKTLRASSGAKTGTGPAASSTAGQVSGQMPVPLPVTQARRLSKPGMEIRGHFEGV